MCLVSAGICLIKEITGGSKLKVQIDMLFKLILAIVLISPFFGDDIEIKLPDISGIENRGSRDYSEIYENSIAERMGENISDVLMSQLRAAGIAIENIRTEVNISKDGSISINKVIVETEDTEAAAVIIRDSLGQETEVINGKV